jgi:hypothetical protein
VLLIPFPLLVISEVSTPSVSFYLSLDSAILHYPATNKKKRREYISSLRSDLLTACFYSRAGSPLSEPLRSLLSPLPDDDNYSLHICIPENKVVVALACMLANQR